MWKDELKAEIGDLMRELDFDSTVTTDPVTGQVIGVSVKNRTTDLKQLCALILELIDHIPEERTTVPFLGWEPPPEKPQ